MLPTTAFAIVSTPVNMGGAGGGGGRSSMLTTHVAVLRGAPSQLQARDDSPSDGSLPPGVAAGPWRSAAAERYTAVIKDRLGCDSTRRMAVPTEVAYAFTAADCFWDDEGVS